MNAIRSCARKYVASNDWTCGGVRHLNSGQVFTALKPFFFAVHPDLFGQFPKEREVNENSLKQLNAYIESEAKPSQSTHLTFYLRNQNNQDKLLSPQVSNVTSSESGKFQAIQINLGQNDIRHTVHSILRKCNLPTSYIDSLPKQPKEQTFSNPFNKNSNINPYAQFWNNFRDRDVDDAEREIRQRRTIPNDLESWLGKNVEDAKTKLHECWPIRDEIIRLRKHLCESLKLKDIIWDCGWGTRHFRGCLESLKALSLQHPETMEILKGKTLIFGRETGVSLDGHVILNSGEVRTNWLDLIRNAHKYDNLIFRIPSVQATLSRTLKDIKVVHRKFGPLRMAESYESLLRKLITSIGDYHRKSSFPKDWPEKLAHLELVVESDAGPLMVSPTGQIIVPASCPPFLLVNFISNNMEEASLKLDLYQKEKYEEIELHEKCVKELGLVALQKDDNVTPSLMIDCCKRLLENQLTLSLQGTHLWITTYYSVLSDGEICIPWNWKSEKDQD
ncbi:unnamed protein product [Allacma fusca]|uniref:T-cell activation inhibitor, mitochondrial n=1 Tax=Allacma fusca TaxID=39272 RepID=A0A8J2JEB5_9HEXA|nr:unnamed protein product [Allacma fusca]